MKKSNFRRNFGIVVLVLGVLFLFGVGCSAACDAVFLEEPETNRFTEQSASPDAPGGKDNPYGSARQDPPPTADTIPWDWIFYPAAWVWSLIKGVWHWAFDAGVLVFLVGAGLVVGLFTLPGWSKLAPGIVLGLGLLYYFHQWVSTGAMF